MWLTDKEKKQDHNTSDALTVSPSSYLTFLFHLPELPHTNTHMHTHAHSLLNLCRAAFLNQHTIRVDYIKQRGPLRSFFVLFWLI